MDKFYLTNKNSRNTDAGGFFIITQVSTILQLSFTKFFSVFFNAKKIFKAIGAVGFTITGYSFENAFNSSAEWLNQLILKCVSVFVLRGGTANVVL